MELDEKTILAIEAARKRVSEGNFVTEEEARKRIFS